ncbi:MAG TPA: type II toxin-antitoxin system antitoxin SocA domain-containing protein, partial [Xanthobacteraceae bacterium]
MFPTYSAGQIAGYILSIADPEDSELSNLKLQTLCYYAQGLCTAMRGAPLFAEPIEAWNDGPVVPALYHRYKQHGSQPIPVIADFNLRQLAVPDRGAITDIYDFYARFSASRLQDMTHREAPWLEAYNSADTIITIDSLVDHFAGQIDLDYVRKLYVEGTASKKRKAPGKRKYPPWHRPAADKLPVMDAAATVQPAVEAVENRAVVAQGKPTPSHPVENR